MLYLTVGLADSTLDSGHSYPFIYILQLKFLTKLSRAGKNYYFNRHTNKIVVNVPLSIYSQYYNIRRVEPRRKKVISEKLMRLRNSTSRG